MEPPRAAVNFSRVEGCYVVLTHPPEVYKLQVWELAGELFAEWSPNLIQLLADGFTNSKYRWEHIIDSPFHIRANALGRIVKCQS